MPRPSRAAPPGSGTPAVVWWLLGINVAVYIAWQMAIRQGPDSGAVQFMSAQFLVSTEAMVHGRVWTLITSTFSHIAPMHLFVNMLALWVFGRDVAKVTKIFGFVQLYLVGGLIASLGHVAFSLISGQLNPALGASGSVMAIAVVYAALFPKRILLLNFFIPVPAALAVGVFILLDLAGVFGGVNPGVAHAAHLGGALYGLIYWAIRVRPKVNEYKRRGAWLE